MSAITGLNENPCVICHESFLETDHTVKCDNERIPHIFHESCATRWAQTRPLGERIICLFCRDGYFLPIQGSLTGNESTEQSARIQRLRGRMDRDFQQLRQAHQEARQEAQEDIQVQRQNLEQLFQLIRQLLNPLPEALTNLENLIRGEGPLTTQNLEQRRLYAEQYAQLVRGYLTPNGPSEHTPS